MNGESEECLRKIAELSPDDIGSTEENVKQTVFVPILKCLGHHESQLDFEYATRGQRIDIFIKGLPEERKVIIDTKSYDEDLNRHFSPFMQGFPFEKRCLLVIKRKELVANIDDLERFLSRESLINADVPKYIKEREEEVKNAYKEAKRLLGHYDDEIKKIKEQTEGLSTKIKDLQSEQKEKTENIWKSLGLEGLHQRANEKGSKVGEGVLPTGEGVYVTAGNFDDKGDGFFELKRDHSVALIVKEDTSTKEVKEILEGYGYRKDKNDRNTINTYGRLN
ncbi:MAG: hypothetical protein J7K81_10325 [Methanophagales archaeon]|nr:hypothetical protein [Methanophagales archaeon]